MKINGVISLRHVKGWSVTVPQRSRLRLPSVRKVVGNHESDEYLSYCIGDKNAKTQDASPQQPWSVGPEAVSQRTVIIRQAYIIELTQTRSEIGAAQ